MSTPTSLTPEALQAIRERVNHSTWIAADKLIKPERLNSPINKANQQYRFDIRALLAEVERLTKQIEGLEWRLHEANNMAESLNVEVAELERENAELKKNR